MEYPSFGSMHHATCQNHLRPRTKRIERLVQVFTQTSGSSAIETKSIYSPYTFQHNLQQQQQGRKFQDEARPVGLPSIHKKTFSGANHFAVLSVVSHKLRLIFIRCRCSLMLGAMFFQAQIELEPTYFLKERLFRDSEFIL